MKNKITVEWSESQKAFHISSLDSTIAKNWQIFKNPNNCNDWTLIGIVDDDIEARKLIENLKSIRGLE